MELDDIDIGILSFLADAPESTTSTIAKALFKVPFNLRKMDCFIRYRLQRFEGDDLLKIQSKGGKKHYSVDVGKVLFGDGVLKMNGVGQVEMGYFIVVKKKNETIAKSIDDYARRIGKKFS